ncbi:leucine-rich repeat-containing protein 71-like isoform X2 [Babylonia areolata]
MYIEGWKVDNTMVSILCDCCLFLDDLVHLQLWNVGLSPLALCTLASVLPRFQCLNSLILDANPLGDANVAPLIDPDNSKLETLSLRFCQLGDINAQALGRALGTTNKWNSKLLTLNLSNNRITDEGVRHLARGLMTNRTLLVLNLAANDIGDDGAAALAQVLSYFALDHQQLLARRQKLAAQIPALPNDLSPYLGLTTRRQRLSPTVSLTHSSRLSLAQRTPSPIDLKQHGLRSPYYGIERRASAESIISQTRRKKNGKWSSRCQKLMMTMAQLRTASKISSEIDLSGHPLLEVVTRHGGHQRFCMVGNRSLFSLNLARNAIGERGLASLWEMVQDQVVAPKGQVQKTPGLKRLVVHRNAVPADNKVLLQLQHYMRLRDPLHKSPLISLNRNNIPPCAMPPIYV